MNPPPSDDLQLAIDQQQSRPASNDGKPTEASEQPDQTPESAESMPVLVAALATWQAAQSIAVIAYATPGAASSSRADEDNKNKAE